MKEKEVKSEKHIREFPEIAHPKKRAFLSAFVETASIVRAAAAAKVSRRCHALWLKEDEAYSNAFAEARLAAGDNLEAEAKRRAADGLIRKKFHQGQPVIDPETGKQYFEHEYSDTLLIFLLKGLLPDKYKERSEQNVNHQFKLEPDVPDWIRRRHAQFSESN